MRNMDTPSRSAIAFTRTAFQLMREWTQETVTPALARRHRYPESQRDRAEVARAPMPVTARIGRVYSKAAASSSSAASAALARRVGG